MQLLRTHIQKMNGKRILVRIDANGTVVNGRVVDDAHFRLDAVLPTIHKCIDAGAIVILIAHNGRPEGVFDATLSLKPVARYYEKVLGEDVLFIETLDIDTHRVVQGLKNGQIAMVENIRYYKGEDTNDLEFAKLLGSLGDIFVNDAFAVSHRIAASIVGITNYLPTYAGLCMEQEINELSHTLLSSAHPLTLVMGGVKAETKIPVITNFLPHADSILIGGAFAKNFFEVREGRIPDGMDHAIVDAIRESLHSQKLHLPLDVVVVDPVSDDVEIMSIKQWIDDERRFHIMDIGPQTIADYQQEISRAKEIVWNGPLGKFEDARFAYGTEAIARSIAQSSARSVVGGGETVHTLSHLKLLEKIDHVSTGGGAMLEFLSGVQLPGIVALK